MSTGQEIFLAYLTEYVGTAISDLFKSSDLEPDLWKIPQTFISLTHSLNTSHSVVYFT